MSTSMPILRKRKIFCSECKREICTVEGTLSFRSALCIICQEEAKGVTLPPEIKAQLMSNSLDVTYMDTTYDPILEENIDSQEKLNSVSGIGYLYRVLKAKVFAVAKAAVETQPAQSSQEIARIKKPRRIFDGPIDPK